MPFHPKFITFDCYGTLIDFQMTESAQDIYGAQLSGEALVKFTKNFSAYRMDEVLGAWKPYKDIVHNAVERTCKANNVTFHAADALAIYNRVPGWGPHPDVTAGLAKVAQHFPLVGLTNADNAQIPHNMERIGVPFAKVITAEDVGAYKPQMRGFEYMLDTLGCGPEEILHVSSSFRYDLMTAHDMGITHKVWVNRGHEPANPYYGYTEVQDISGLPAVLGL